MLLLLLLPTYCVFHEPCSTIAKQTSTAESWNTAQKRNLLGHRRARARSQQPAANGQSLEARSQKPDARSQKPMFNLGATNLQPGPAHPADVLVHFDIRLRRSARLPHLRGEFPLSRLIGSPQRELDAGDRLGKKAWQKLALA